MNNQLKITRLISISISKYIFSKLVALMSHVRGNHFTVQSLNRLCRFSFLSHSTPILAARKDCQPCQKNHMSQSFQPLCESKLLNQRKQKKINFFNIKKVSLHFCYKIRTESPKLNFFLNTCLITEPTSFEYIFEFRVSVRKLTQTA